MKNYLKKERIHYSVSLKSSGKDELVQLWEHIDGMNRHHENMIGVVFSWRADMIRVFLDKLASSYQYEMANSTISSQLALGQIEDYSKDSNKAQWNAEYSLPQEIALKLLLAMKLSSSIDRRPRIEEALEIVHALSDEEIAFWVWKLFNLKNRALSSFKAMYL